MNKHIKHIVREVPAEQSDFSFYFDDDGLTSAGGDYCYNLFIVAQSRNSSGFNEKEYQNIQNEIENLLEMYEDIVNKSIYAQYSSIGAMLFDLGLVSSIHNTRRIKAITEWLNACNEKPNSPWGNYETQAEIFPEKNSRRIFNLQNRETMEHGHCARILSGRLCKNGLLLRTL